MQIQEIYRQYHIPSSLKQHMLAVAAVGKYITDHWQGPAIDSSSILAALLVHDLGNLVKFDLSPDAKVVDPELHTEYWRNIQEKMKTKYGYGSDAHEATLMMLEELKIAEKIIDLVENMGASLFNSIANSESMELKICEYADLRVVPYGIVPMMERLTDLRHRYSDHLAWEDEELFEAIVDDAKQLEKKIQANISVKLNPIPPEKINAFLLELPQFKIQTS